MFETYSAALMSNVGRVLVILVWLIYISISAWGCSQLKIDFKTTYFVDEAAFVANYITK